MPYEDYCRRKSFLRALFRWRGSLWKGVFKQLLTWLLYYYTVRFALQLCTPDEWKPTLKAAIKLFGAFTDRIPLQFLLGFYVVQMVTRWWAQVSFIIFSILTKRKYFLISMQQFFLFSQVPARNFERAFYIIFLSWQNIVVPICKVFCTAKYRFSPLVNLIFRCNFIQRCCFEQGLF